MQLYHLELVNNNIVALNILTDSKIIFSSYCSGSIVQNTFDLHERYSWRLWYLGWSMHNSDIYKYVHFDDYLLQPLGLNSLWREREKEVALYSLGCHTVFYICYWRRKCYKIMKCFCKLPGKHHHELWYTLSGFHIVRLPLDSQLGLYILSWEQFWISYFLFSSDFPYAFCISFAYYFSLNAFAIAFWCILFFPFFLFACVCVCVRVCVLLLLLWLATLCACLIQLLPRKSQQMHVCLSGRLPNPDFQGGKTSSSPEPEAKKEPRRESKKRKESKIHPSQEQKR